MAEHLTANIIIMAIITKCSTMCLHALSATMRPLPNSEDFAEIFAEALNNDNAAVEKSCQEGFWSNEVCQKIMYVKQLFNQYAGAEILN